MYNMGVGLVTKMSVAILLIWHGIFFVFIHLFDV